MHSRTYDANQCVALQGDMVTHVLFVAHGAVKASESQSPRGGNYNSRARAIMRRPQRAHLGQPAAHSTKQSQWARQAASRRSGIRTDVDHCMTVSVLRTKSAVGEAAAAGVRHARRHTASLITLTPVEILMV